MRREDFVARFAKASPKFNAKDAKRLLKGNRMDHRVGACTYLNIQEGNAVKNALTLTLKGIGTAPKTA